jgi:PTH1 family peptidyl-tRNA hydrolase
MQIIVGLGNPGPRYRGTRHNIGFRCVDLMAQKWDIKVSERRARAVLGRGRHLDQDIVLAKPRTFMNHSGEGVAYLVARFGVKPQDLLVVYDEMALPVGKLRLRPSGSDAGHNGIKSIIAALGTQDFPRIRVGIGKPSAEGQHIAHVIGGFSDDESPIIAAVVERVVEAVDCLLHEGIDRTMSRFNQNGPA